MCAEQFIGQEAKIPTVPTEKTKREASDDE